jgi:hypothetical protein
MGVRSITSTNEQHGNMHTKALFFPGKRTFSVIFTAAQWWPKNLEEPQLFVAQE